MDSLYLRSAVTTVAVLIPAIVSVWIVVIGILELPTIPHALLDKVAGIGLFMATALVTSTLLAAGLLDHIVGFDLPGLRRWIQRLKQYPLEWVDCYASADPVSNGALLEEPEVKASSKEVCNESSILRDHTAYWTNRDQFVTFLVERITRLRGRAALLPAPELAMDERALNWIERRRSWRVGILGMSRWVCFLSIALAVYREFQTWSDTLVYSVDQIWLWVAGGEPNAASDVNFSWRALGLLALGLVPYWLTRQSWRAWNEIEMRALVEHQVSAVDDANLQARWGRVMGFFSFQLLIVAGLLNWVLYQDSFLDGWAYFLTAGGILAAAIVVVVGTEPSVPDKSKLRRRGADV